MNDTMTSDPVVGSAARWFWWIAGLSLVNTILYYSGSDTSFVIGLAMTAFAGGVFADQMVIGFAVTAVILGFYVAMGHFGQREKAWAFYAGLVVYVIDAFIYVKFEDWMPVAFHAYAIFCIVKGLMALRERGDAPTVEVKAEAAEAGQ